MLSPHARISYSICVINYACIITKYVINVLPLLEKEIWKWIKASKQHFLKVYFIHIHSQCYNKNIHNLLGAFFKKNLTV